MSGYKSFWYLKIYFWDRRPLETSLVGAEGSDSAPESGSKVVSSVVFLLKGTGYGVGSAEEGSISNSRG